MNKNPDTVLLYGPTWDAPAQLSKHHLARYWSQSRRILYVESPFNPASFFTRRAEGKRLLHRYLHGPVNVAERLWIQTFIYPLPYRGTRFLFGARWVNTINQYFVLPQLRRVLRRLGFDDPVLLVCSAHAFPIVKHIPHQLLAYHCSDDFTLVPSFPRSFHEIEAYLIRKSDMVIATAEDLRIAKSHLNNNIYTVTNGVEYEHFAQTKEQLTTTAPELSALQHPVIGYIGSVFRWIDQGMVVHAAKKHPDWSFVFIGPIQTDVSLLRSMPNIHLLGPRKYKSLPEYLKVFDIATIPFTQDDLTKSVSPIKFYEYLASGTPVVATYMPDLAKFADIARIVKTDSEYASALEETLVSDTSQLQELRMNEAKKHSWKEKFKKIDELIDSAIEHQAML